MICSSFVVYCILLFYYVMLYLFQSILYIFLYINIPLRTCISGNEDCLLSFRFVWISMCVSVCVFSHETAICSETLDFSRLNFGVWVGEEQLTTTGDVVGMGCHFSLQLHT